MKWLVALIYHPIMIPMCIVSLFLPMMIYTDIQQILQHEVPVGGGYSVIVGFIALLIYIAMKSPFFGAPYRAVTILLPLLQMIIYTSLALSSSVWVLNKWANDGAFSKGTAIFLAILAFIISRLLISVLYRKYPLIKSEGKITKAAVGGERIGQ